MRKRSKIKLVAGEAPLPADLMVASGGSVGKHPQLALALALCRLLKARRSSAPHVCMWGATQAVKVHTALTRELAEPALELN